jgi:hypothetical protein
MKNVIFAVMLFFALPGVMAQEKGFLVFEEETYDFETIEEADGPVEHKFEFKNTSGQDIVIENVKASCGCTTPAWSREAVKPGEKGFVTARYNPTNRPGSFKKSLTLTTTDPEKNIYQLFIKGYVNPKPKGIEDEFPLEMGSLRVESKVVNFGRMQFDYENKFDEDLGRTKKIYLYNQSDKIIELTGEYKGPEHISLTFDSLRIRPKSTVPVILTYDPDARSEFGYQSDNIAIITDDPDLPEKELYVVATLEEYFGSERPDPNGEFPKLALSNRIIDFGELSQEVIENEQVTVTNVGKIPLNIRKIISNCNCVKTTVSSEDIQPGESAVISVEFTTGKRRGLQNKALTIYSNDPFHPSQYISIKAKVESDS